MLIIHKKKFLSTGSHDRFQRFDFFATRVIFNMAPTVIDCSDLSSIRNYILLESVQKSTIRSMGDFFILLFCEM